jgi:YVTN family beta-propeller protein
MIRQVLVCVVLGLAHVASAQEGAIPLSRLKADAVVPVALAPGAGHSPTAIWIPDRAAGAVIPVNAKDNKPGLAIPIGAQPCASLVFAFKSVWVPSCGDGKIARINPDDSKAAAAAKVAVGDPMGTIATAVGSIWVVTDRKGIVTRIDPDTNEPVAEVFIAGGASAIVFANDALWVTSGGNRLTRVNPNNNEVIESIDVGPKAGRLAALDGSIWTLNQGDGSVSRVDAATNKVVATIKVGESVAAGEIAAGEGSVWISAIGVPLVRIDPRTNKVAQRFSGDGGGAVLVAHGSLWIAAGPQVTWRLDPKLVAAMR